MTAEPSDIAVWEFDVLKSVGELSTSQDSIESAYLEPRNGWFTNVDVRTHLGSPSLSTRTALSVLAVRGLLAEKTFQSARYFRLTPAGERRLTQPPPIELDDTIKSYSWTGVVDPVQAERALAIVSEMEDVCEQLTNNHERAQIMGLVRALEILLTVPEPPRAGVVALVRDPAFGNIIQVAAFLAALIAAVKP